MRHAYLSCLVLVSSLIGCGGEKDDGPENLSRFRVIGVTSSAPDVSLFEVLLGQPAELELGVVDFHPGDVLGRAVGRTYEWTACFSIGAITKFECLDPEKVLKHTSTDGSFNLTLDTSTLLTLIPELLLGDKESDGDESPDLMEEMEADKEADPCPEGAGNGCSTDDDCDSGLTCVEEHCAPGPSVSPIPLIVRVKVTSDDDEVIEAARTVQIRFLGDNNKNPAPGSLKIREAVVPLKSVSEGCTPLGPFDTAVGSIPLEYVADSDVFDTYTDYRFNECADVNETDEAIISWYASRGSLENALGALDFPKNELSLEEEAGTVRLFMSLRDGRNGLIVSCVDLEFSDSQTP